MKNSENIVTTFDEVFKEISKYAKDGFIDFMARGDAGIFQQYNSQTGLFLKRLLIKGQPF